MTKTLLMTAATFAFIPLAFDNKKGWKKDDDGNLVLKDGNPVYVNSDGKEGTIDPTSISRLNGEAKTNRERAEAAETKLAAFDGLDPKAAKEAIQKMKDVDTSKMINAGELDKVKATLTKEFETKLAEKDQEIENLGGKLNGTLLETAFAGSKYIKDNVAVPVEMIRAAFGGNFKVKDGVITPIQANGDPIYSSDKIGEVASFDEAIGQLINSYPEKDAILKAPDQRGSGNSGAGGNDQGGKKTITRADFDKMAAADKAKAAADMGKGELVLSD